jgi:hypothetical protein
MPTAFHQNTHFHGDYILTRTPTGLLCQHDESAKYWHDVVVFQKEIINEVPFLPFQFLLLSFRFSFFIYIFFFLVLFFVVLYI